MIYPEATLCAKDAAKREKSNLSPTLFSNTVSRYVRQRIFHSGNPLLFKLWFFRTAG